MFRAASIKLGLDYAVMHNMQGQGGGGGTVQGVEGISADRVENVSALSKKELENLLKHGTACTSCHNTSNVTQHHTAVSYSTLLVVTKILNFT